MALAVKKFFHTIPQLPYRFVADFVVDGAMLNNMRFAVRSVKYTEAEGNTSDAATYYGNGYYTIPIWDISSRALSITFEETDDMQVTALLDTIAALSYNKTPAMIAIVLREYDNMFMKVLRGRCFWVYLQDYDEPAFSRTGGPSVVSINANFIVRAVSNGFNVDDAALANKLSQIGKALNTFNNQKDETNSVWYNELKKTAKETKEDTTFNVDLSAFAVKDDSTTRYRDDTNGYKGTQNTLQFMEKAQRLFKDDDGNNVTLLAVVAANNASGTRGKNMGDTTLTNDEAAFAKELNKGLQSTKGGKVLAEVYYDNRNVAYHLGNKKADPDNGKGLDCSGYVITYLQKMGYDISFNNSASTGNQKGGLEYALREKGVKEVGDLDALKPGDVVTAGWQGKTMGHTMVFVGYAENGDMIFNDSSGSRGVSTSRYTKEQIMNREYKAFSTHNGPK